MAHAFVLFAVAAIGSVAAAPKCMNGSFNGKPCATTTHFSLTSSGQPGSCGCGSSSASFAWAKSAYTAAANEAFFNGNSKFGSWCGSACGRCYKLTTTGGSVNGQGSGAPAGRSITVMVVDACPRAGNQNWCGQGLNGLNKYGYPAHFDLTNDSGQINKLGWDNPEVTYEAVACGGGGSPTSTQFNSCTCKLGK